MKTKCDMCGKSVKEDGRLFRTSGRNSDSKNTMRYCKECLEKYNDITSNKFKNKFNSYYNLIKNRK